MLNYITISGISIIVGMCLGSYLFDILIVRPMNFLIQSKHTDEKNAAFDLGRRQGIELALEKLNKIV